MNILQEKDKFCKYIFQHINSSDLSTESKITELLQTYQNQNFRCKKAQKEAFGDKLYKEISGGSYKLDLSPFEIKILDSIQQVNFKLRIPCQDLQNIIEKKLYDEFCIFKYMSTVLSNGKAISNFPIVEKTYRMFSVLCCKDMVDSNTSSPLLFSLAEKLSRFKNLADQESIVILWKCFDIEPSVLSINKEKRSSCDRFRSTLKKIRDNYCKQVVSGLTKRSTDEVNNAGANGQEPPHKHTRLLSVEFMATQDISPDHSINFTNSEPFPVILGDDYNSTGDIGDNEIDTYFSFYNSNDSEDPAGTPLSTLAYHSSSNNSLSNEEDQDDLPDLVKDPEVQKILDRTNQPTGVPNRQKSWIKSLCNHFGFARMIT